MALYLFGSVYRKVYPTPLKPIKISFDLGIFIPIEAFTWIIFIRIVILNRLQCSM